MKGFHRTSQLLFATLATSVDKLLPGIPTTKRGLLLSLLDGAKIQRLFFLRHGKTGPAPKGGVDFDRQLVDEGKNQARKSGSVFGQTLKPFYPIALVSPAPRTAETAELFLEASGSGGGSTFLLPVPILYDGTMQPKGKGPFQKLGYSPLRDYIQNEDDQLREDSRQVLGEYASNVVEATIDALIQDNQSDSRVVKESSTLLIVGHAIYLPAAALAFASLICEKDDMLDVIMDRNTAEAEGYLLDVRKKRIEYLSRDL